MPAAAAKWTARLTTWPEAAKNTLAAGFEGKRNPRESAAGREHRGTFIG